MRFRMQSNLSESLSHQEPRSIDRVAELERLILTHDKADYHAMNFLNSSLPGAPPAIQRHAHYPTLCHFIEFEVLLLFDSHGKFDARAEFVDDAGQPIDREARQVCMTKSGEIRRSDTG